MLAQLTPTSGGVAQLFDVNTAYGGALLSTPEATAISQMML